MKCSDIFRTNKMNTASESRQYTRTLITYEQCNEESIDELLNWCKSVFENKIKNILAFKKENNKDKEIKLYIYINFNKRTRVNENKLIYRNFKPNIEGITKDKLDELLKYNLIYLND